MRWLAALFLFVSLNAWCEIDSTLVEKLRAGGYVLYLRHASTNFSRNDARMKGYEDCENPIGAVLASPFCRTMETARLAFGSARAMQEARGGPARTDEPARYDPLRKLLSTPPPPGKNTAIASHGNPFYAVFGPPYLAEGEMAVVDPSALAIVGRVRLEDWQAFK